MIWRPTRRARAAQWVLLAAAAGVALLLASLAGANLARQHLPFGFGFLADRANFDIPFRLVRWEVGETYARALLVCTLNTLLVSAMGIVAATLLGLLVGIMRLTDNWLVRNLALGFVELVRNTPQLVQIVFWYVAVLQTLPGPRQSIHLPGGILLNIRGLYLPGWADGAIHYPALRGFNISGGVQIPPELVAVWAGLSIYASAFIAEIVRAAILSVHRGQREAALSLGLRPGQVLRKVILPQALRVIVPPLTSQYLHLIKSSSLGAAVAYPELFQIFAGTVL
ncbi:MAG: ABC transporter permease subunit, partial [Acetobacteraceae bacterium]|nr:ABC transporter permease subunit [Acetobacteraceae bacterium]